MKRFMMFSVSVLCLAVAVLIGFYVGSQQVEAETIIKEHSYTNLIVATGLTSSLPPYGEESIEYPAYADGPRAIADECHVIATPYMGNVMGGLGASFAGIIYGDTGFIIRNEDSGTNRSFNYLVICTRDGQPVSTDQSTWGNIKQR